MYLIAFIYLSIVLSNHSAAAQMDKQGTCGCCPGVPGIPGNHGQVGASGPVGPKGDTGIKGSNGPKGEKGDIGFHGEVGSVGLQGVPGEVGLPGVRGEKGEKGEKNEINKSAFHVAFNTSPGQVPADVPIKYDTIITNIGSHYNTETGKFLCQYPGFYAFHFTILKDEDGDAWAGIIKNGVVVAGGGASNSGYSSSSNMAVLNLVAGDEVWIQAYDSDWNYFDGSYWRECTFSGFLLYPE